VLENPISEPLFEDFQEQVFEEPKFSSAGKKASVLDQRCTYNILVYFVVCRNCMIGVSLRVPILEITRTLFDYSMVTRKVEWLGYF
jgi:hypothetical protein